MNNQPIVSVLMASYNGSEYISEAIESVLNQTYVNFELIISDDCSTDQTLEIVKSYEKKDSRIQVYINASNLGDYPNRNKAASYARGVYLKYLDHDDIMYPHCLEVMIKSMENFPDATFGIQSPKIEDQFPYPFQIIGSLAIKEHYLFGGLFLTGPTGAIIRKSSFEAVGGFSGERFLGDTELWLRLASVSFVVKFQPSLIWWRVHDGQESQQQKKSYLIILARYELDKIYILSDFSEMTELEKIIAYKKLNRRLIINTIAQLLKTKKKLVIIKNFLSLKISLGDFVRAIFH